MFILRRNDDVATMVLQAGAHGPGTTAQRLSGRGVRLAAPRPQLGGLHRGQVLCAHL